MKGRGWFGGASFGPEALKAMGAAFDQAWAEIAGDFGNIPFAIESARLRLAEAMLSIATEDSTNVAALKAGALQAMALHDGSGTRPIVTDRWPSGHDAPSSHRPVRVLRIKGAALHLDR
jgi:hypothetical protein